MTYFRFGLEKKHQSIGVATMRRVLKTLPAFISGKAGARGEHDDGCSLGMIAADECSGPRRNMYATAEEICRMFEMMRDRGRWQRTGVGPCHDSAGLFRNTAV